MYMYLCVYIYELSRWFSLQQEMARVNVDILGISELKWTGIGELTQMTIICTTVGWNPLEEME